MHVPNDRYPQGPETAQAVAQFWTRIGVKTQVEVVPWAVYSGRANKNEFAVSMLAWGNGTGEASYALVNILATVDAKKGLGASNWGHYSNPKVDAALDQSTSNSTWPSVKPSCATRSSWCPTTSASSRCTTTRTSGPPRRA